MKLSQDIILAAAEKPAQKPRHKTTRDCPRVTVRFSPEDYERIQALADGMALSVYLRAKALNEPLPRRKLGSKSSIEDQAVIAQLLGLLGQSRIANNLNQLAYHANIALCTWMRRRINRLRKLICMFVRCSKS